MHHLKSSLTRWAAILLFTLPLPALARTEAPTGALTKAKLEQAMGRLLIGLEKTAGRTQKMQILIQYRKGLRGEIRKMADAGVRDSVYWKAIDLDEVLIRMLERQCSELKSSIIAAEHNPVDNDQTRLTAETENNLALADAFCRN